MVPRVAWYVVCGVLSVGAVLCCAAAWWSGVVGLWALRGGREEGRGEGEVEVGERREGSGSGSVGGGVLRVVVCAGCVVCVVCGRDGQAETDTTPHKTAPQHTDHTTPNPTPPTTPPTPPHLPPKH